MNDLSETLVHLSALAHALDRELLTNVEALEAESRRALDAFERVDDRLRVEVAVLHQAFEFDLVAREFVEVRHYAASVSTAFRASLARSKSLSACTSPACLAAAYAVA